MEFLAKFPKVKNSTAGLIIFLAWYAAATFTTLVMEDMTATILSRTGLVLLTILGYMTVVFMLSRLLNRTDVVDGAWGGAFIVAALASWALNPFGLEIGWNVQTIVTVLVTLWGMRLSYYIVRRLLSHSEDKRYIELRKKWRGNEAINAYVRIFVIQALLATAIAIAVIHINLANPQTVSTLTIIGGIIWLIGFLFEAVGDWQLRRHLANPANKDKLMTSGLWRCTRHPNYFGEALLWWGVFIIALSTPLGWVGVLTPVIITYLLLFVSGVPPTEKSFEGKRGWKAYKKHTSVFLPLPPK